MGITLVTQGEGPYDSAWLLQNFVRNELILTLLIWDRVLPLLSFFMFLSESSGLLLGGLKQPKDPTLTAAHSPPTATRPGCPESQSREAAGSLGPDNASCPPDSSLPIPLLLVLTKLRRAHLGAGFPLLYSPFRI